MAALRTWQEDYGDRWRGGCLFDNLAYYDIHPEKRGDRYIGGRIDGCSPGCHSHVLDRIADLSSQDQEAKPAGFPPVLIQRHAGITSQCAPTVACLRLFAITRNKTAGRESCGGTKYNCSSTHPLTYIVDRAHNERQNHGWECVCPRGAGGVEDPRHAFDGKRHAARIGGGHC